MADPVEFIAALAGTNSSTRFLSASLDGDMKIIVESGREGKYRNLSNLRRVRVKFSKDAVLKFSNLSNKNTDPALLLE